jgi:hypothetical protein
MEMDLKEKGRGQKNRHSALIVDLARRHNSARTKKINEIAEWMAAEVKGRGKLDHHEAANAIRMRSPYLDVTGGEALFWRSKNATPAMARFERSTDLARPCCKLSES